MGFPDFMHGRGTQSDHISHGAHGPVTGLMRRGLQRQGDHFIDLRPAHQRDPRGTRFIAQEPRYPFAHKAFLPAPDTGFRLAGSGHDRTRAQSIAAKKNNPSPPYMLLRGTTIRNNRVQTTAIISGDSK